MRLEHFLNGIAYEVNWRGPSNQIVYTVPSAKVYCIATVGDHEGYLIEGPMPTVEIAIQLIQTPRLSRGIQAVTRFEHMQWKGVLLIDIFNLGQARANSHGELVHLVRDMWCPQHYTIIIFNEDVWGHV